MISTPAIARKSLIPLIIGLDFGTHSTKIVLRRRGESTARLLCLQRPYPDYPVFANPSVVGIVDNRVYFGGEALRTTPDPYRSLKVHLLPPSNGQGGHYRGPSFAGGNTPEFLVSLYLSWLFQLIRTHLDETYGRGQTKVAINLAAPMDHFEVESLRDRYLHVVQAAWESSFGAHPISVSQGASVHDLRTYFLPWLDPSAPVASLEERPYDVLPETVAPIVSLSHDPRLAPGMFLIVDMGAGTSEISIDNVISPHGWDPKVTCYCDTTHYFGANDFEFRQPARVIQELTSASRETWRNGFLKDAPSHLTHPRWQQLTVVLAGGGTRRADVGHRLRNIHIPYLWGKEEFRSQVISYSPMGIEGDMNEDGSLLAVAHGLSFPRREWPRMFPPSDIQVRQHTRQIPRPEPHWVQ